MINIAVLISGRGSNLLSIIKNFGEQVKVVMSSSPKAFGLKYAKQYNIPSEIVESEGQIINEINKHNIGLICMAGFMRKLSSTFTKKYTVLNIHPSLLPRYKGLNVHKQVLDNKEEFTGCTVHYATGELDSGEIIMQREVKIDKDETKESLELKVLNEEHKLYPKAIRKVLDTIQPRYDYTTKEIIEAMDRINAR